MASAPDELLHRRAMARSAAALFGAAATVTGLGLLAPHVPEVDVAVLEGVTAGAALLAALLLALGPRIPVALFYVVATLGTVLVSSGLFGNGERHGGPAGGDEMYYLAIALWSAYHFTRRALGVQVVLILAAYPATLLAMGVTENAVSRWLTIAGLVIGASIVVRILSERVERLIRELRVAAFTDPLTGLPNRRGLEAAYARELEQHARTGRPFALLVADLDRFKQINDRLGHKAGDRALVEVAALFREHGRDADIAARIGGDEFAILLPDTDGEPAAEVAMRIAAAVRSHADEAGWQAGISVGVSVAGPDGHDLDELMRSADARLYDAKHASRGPRRAA